MARETMNFWEIKKIQIYEFLAQKEWGKIVKNRRKY
jgi:hypothetical protein